MLSLTIGCVGCMLAGVFALQTPKAQPVEALTSSLAGKISYVLPNNTTATDLRTIFWIDGLGTGMLDIPVGETSQTNSALANFAKQVKIIKADASTTTMDQYGTIEVFSNQEIRWNGISSGDTIIIRQGTTFQYDANNDGTYEDDFVAMYSFQLT